MLKRLAIAFAFVAVAVTLAFADPASDTIDRATNNAIDACFIQYSYPYPIDHFRDCVARALRSRAVAYEVLHGK